MTPCTSRFRHGGAITRRTTQVTRAGTYLLLSGIMMSVTIILAVYVIVFVHNPSKKYMNGKAAKCKIITAERSCWRRNLISSARIEEGRNICWHFLVRYDDVFTNVQYMDIDDFPEEHDGCNSAKRCGLETWPCRVSVDDPKDVALRWVYPFKPVIYSCVGIICSLIFGFLTAWNFYKERNYNDETTGQDLTLEETVPFSFRTRLPTWMRKKPAQMTIPAPAAMP